MMPRVNASLLYRTYQFLNVLNVFGLLLVPLRVLTMLLSVFLKVLRLKHIKYPRNMILYLAVGSWEELVVVGSLQFPYLSTV